MKTVAIAFVVVVIIAAYFIARFLKPEPVLDKWEYVWIWWPRFTVYEELKWGWVWRLRFKCYSGMIYTKYKGPDDDLDD